MRSTLASFNITEVCVFVPDFDKESFTFHCAADAKETMEIVHFTTELNDYDKTCLKFEPSRLQFSAIPYLISPG